MENEHVLSALTKKRAELAGEIRAIEKRGIQVTRDLEHLDNTLLLFDATISLRRSNRERGANSRPELGRER